jgi:hypothetical protein
VGEEESYKAFRFTKKESKRFLKRTYKIGIVFPGLKGNTRVLWINISKWREVDWQFIGSQEQYVVKHINKLVKDNSVSSSCEMEPITVIITKYTQIHEQEF